MKSTDFEDGHFKLYINSGFSGKTYVDLDSADGVKIALAKLENGQYIPIQEEIMRASFDGRDFGKFELMLSDEIISKHTDSDGNVTYNPTEIKINGIFEYSGMDRTQYVKGQTHNKHIAGLDVYYSTDHEYKGETVVQSWMHQVGDIANNGIAVDDVIPVNEASEYINVYLVAHYLENNKEELRIIDNKLIRVIPTADGEKGEITDDQLQTIEENVKNVVLGQAQQNINTAKSELEGKLTTAQTTLQKAIDAEKEARESEDKIALEKAQEALASASSQVERLNDAEEALNTLNGLFTKDSEGKYKLNQDVLDEQDIYDLSLAGLGAKAKDLVGEEAIAADEV